MIKTTRWPNQLRSVWKNCQKPRVNKLLHSNYLLQKEIVKIGYFEALAAPGTNKMVQNHFTAQHKFPDLNRDQSHDDGLGKNHE